MDIVNCPSSLAEGYFTYSLKARKSLFAGQKVNHLLDFGVDEFRTTGLVADAMHRISVSGVQEKFPAVVRDRTLVEHKQIPANEHLTMQIASQVYGIMTAENGLCFTPKGEMVYITRRFDILPDGSKLPMEDFASVPDAMSRKTENTSSTAGAMST